MWSFRRRLQVWATAWLVFQAVSLSALVRLDCCAAHRPEAAAEKHDCHGRKTGAHCPMPAADGTACPMHRGTQTGAEQACIMHGACDGPATGLAALVSQPGILSDAHEIAPDPQVSLVPLHLDVRPTGRLALPDTPPPRA